MKPKSYIPKIAPIVEVVLRFVVLLCLFTLTRLIFFWFNRAAFPEFTAAIFWNGVRFDAAAIAILNCPYIFFKILPFAFVENRAARLISECYFLIINGLALLTNLIDTCYYPFAMRRLTIDIFNFLGATNNFGALVPGFLRDYAGVVAIALGVLLLLFLGTKFSRAARFQKNEMQTELTRAARLTKWTKQLILRLLIVALCLLAARGGWQFRPMTVAVAGGVAGAENAALVLNTPYTLLSSCTAKSVQRVDYFSDEECAQLFDTQIVSDGSVPEILAHQPRPTNVVVLIMEGFASEYSTYLADEPKALAGNTPFLDSLAQQSIVFRGYANGKQSIEAVTSILGGVPSLLATPFCQSQYASAPVRYALTQLRKQGWRTLFYHGGENGSMNIDRSAYLTGIEHYFGKNEYPASLVKRDYDGQWGIADVPYLQHVADCLDGERSPFFATIFTLSSHAPYTIPSPYDTILPQTELLMQRAVAYADEALRQFFARIEKSPWFDETLFVITSDHTNLSDAPNVDLLAQRFSIPMFFYFPQADTAFRSERIMQQVDIMPTIFHYCGISGAFASFGKSAFDDDAPHFAINFISERWRMYIDDYLVEFDGERVSNIWDITQKSVACAPAQVPAAASYERLLRAVIQRYYNGLLDNNW